MCEHLKRPIIIGISWTKANTHQLTQNNEVITETTEYQIISILEKEHKDTTSFMQSSGHRHQQHGRNQSGDHPRPTLVKCKPQHLYIPHDSRPKRQRAKHTDTICHCKLQSP